MNWDQYFFSIAELAGSRSEDPSIKIGCVIVDSKNRICATGYNGLAKGVLLTDERLERPEKYLYFCHAERNAIFQSASRGVALDGCRMYCPWIPCADCARAIIQTGIVEVIIGEKHRKTWKAKKQWQNSMDATLQMFAEARVNLNVLDDDGLIKPYGKWIDQTLLKEIT